MDHIRRHLARLEIRLSAGFLFGLSWKGLSPSGFHNNGASFQSKASLLDCEAGHCARFHQADKSRWFLRFLLCEPPASLVLFSAVTSQQPAEDRQVTFALPQERKPILYLHHVAF